MDVRMNKSEYLLDYGNFFPYHDYCYSKYLPILLQDTNVGSSVVEETQTHCLYYTT